MTDLELGFRTAINLLEREVRNLENAASHAPEKLECETLSEEALAYRKAIRLLEDQKDKLFCKQSEICHGC